jgi:hypothetical protein
VLIRCFGNPFCSSISHFWFRWALWKLSCCGMSADSQNCKAIRESRC